MLDDLSIAHNRLGRMTWVWWPFLMFRPGDDEKLPFLRTIAMAPCFAAFSMAIYSLRFVFWPGASLTTPEVDFSLINFSEAVFDLYLRFVIVFLIWFNVVTRPLWNRGVLVAEKRRVVKTS